MRTRRRWLLAVGLAAFAPWRAFPQQRPARIGFLDPLGPGVPEGDATRNAFLAGLREHGWIDGQTVLIEYRPAFASPERYAALAAELSRLQVDVIVTGGDQLTVAVRKANPSTPIVMAAVGDPVASGLVTSLAHPGGNVTGISNLATGFPAKWLELFKELLPDAVRFAALRNLGNATHDRFFAEIEAAAAKLRVRLSSIGYRTPADLESALASVARQKAQGLLVLPDPIVNGHHATVAAFVTRNRMPSAFLGVGQAANAGLFSYGPNRPDQYRRAAAYVDRILRGAKPADLPIEQPTKFDLVVNLKTARALGIGVPRSFLLRADRVIE